MYLLYGVSLVSVAVLSFVVLLIGCRNPVRPFWAGEGACGQRIFAPGYWNVDHGMLSMFFNPCSSFTQALLRLAIALWFWPWQSVSI